MGCIGKQQPPETAEENTKSDRAYSGASMRRCFCFLSCWLHLSLLSCALKNVSCSSTAFTFDAATNLDKFNLEATNNGEKATLDLTQDGKIFLINPPDKITGLASVRYKIGRVSYAKPIPLSKYRNRFFSFSTSFKFQILTAKYNESGDGIAFFMTTDAQMPANSTGGYLGLLPQDPHTRNGRFVAVEFDTFQNLETGFDDPSASHIGIDINNLSSVAVRNTTNEFDPLYLYHNYSFTARVSYNASNQSIQVWATSNSNVDIGSFQPYEDPLLQFRFNLSQLFENHTDVYVGIVAASGNNSQVSILYSWNFQVVGESPNKNQLWYIIIIPIVLVGLGVAYICIYFRRRRQSTKLLQEYEASIHASSGGVRRYKYEQLERATQRFSEMQIIGRGGYSTVYKGVLPDETQVAVKRMTGNIEMAENESIARELQIISKIRHRHLLELRGWCYRKGQAFLVYDYMPKGSLDSYLYGQKRRSGEVINSETRFKIIMGVAAALEYLHGDLPGSYRVLHRDVKAANVLLSDTMEPMLADFGLSRLIANDDQMVTITLQAGTPGYVAPEVLASRQVDDKVDVYSFGVLALELACGRQALSVGDLEYDRLVDWVWLQYQRTSILDALDPELAHSLSVFSSSNSWSHNQPGMDGEMAQKWLCVLHLGLLCCQASPHARPRMREVHQALKECKVLPPPRSWVLYPAATPYISHHHPAQEHPPIAE